MAGQDGTTFSPACHWQLRTGAKDNPTMRHLEALARFCEVSPSYFFDVRQFVASRNETLRRMSVTLLGLSDESHLLTSWQVACASVRTLPSHDCPRRAVSAGTGLG